MNVGMAAFSSLHFGVSMRLFRDHQQQKVEAFKAFEAGSGDRITHLSFLTEFKVTTWFYLVNILVSDVTISETSSGYELLAVCLHSVGVDTSKYF